MASKETMKKESAKNVAENRLKSMFSGINSLADIDRLFEEYFIRNGFRQLRPGLGNMHDLWGTYEMRAPNIDVIDRDKDVLIRAELPGVDKKDLDVSVHDNMLTIKGESHYESS